MKKSGFDWVWRLLGCAIFLFIGRESWGQRDSSTLPIDTIQARQLLKQATDLRSQGNLEKALEVATSAYEILVKLGIENDAQMANACEAIGNFHLDLYDLDNALYFFFKSERTMHQIGMGRTIRMAILLRSIGRCFTFQGNFQKAADYSHKALAIAQKLLPLNHPRLSSFYLILGASLVLLEKYQESILCLEKSLEIETINGKTVSPTFTSALSNLGKAHFELGEVEKSLFYIQKAIEIKENSKEVSLDLAELYGNASLPLTKMKRFDEALTMHKKALEIQNEILPEDDPSRIHLFLQIADTYKQIGQIDSAEYWTLKGVNLFHFESYNRSSAFSYVFNEMGIHYLLRGDSIRARAYFDSSYLFHRYVPHNNLNNVIDLPVLQENLQSESVNYLRNYRKTGALPYLNIALDKSVESIGVIYQRDKEPVDFVFSSTAHEVFDAFLNSKYFLNERLPSNNFCPEAFSALEQARAIQLSAQIAESKALQFAGIPEETLKKEAKIREEITNLEEERHQLLQNGKAEDSPEYLAVAGQVFDANEKWAALKTQLERDYPDYFRLKYDHKTISLQEAQQKLAQPGQTYLEYFAGEEAVFLLAFTRDSARFLKIPLDFPLDSTIADLRRALTSERATGASRFAETAHLLYQKLIFPVRDLISGEVVIVPDGVLGYLPFEVLLVEKPEKPNRFREHHYFLKDCAVGYALSSTLQLQMREQKHRAEPSGKFAAFAPFFDGDTATLSQLFVFDDAMRKDFQPLAASGEEAFGTAKLMRGEAILGPDATRQRFEEMAPKYRVLHLATHGKADDQTGDYAFLAFSKPKDSLTHDLLFVRDLYNMRLNADLVTLSACETGIGKLRRGEGIISLARAFVFAGAKSIVTSLWEVNDSKSKDLMLLFYKNLRRGMPKNEALRQAKLAFLEKQDNVGAHPFFWSGFIGLGDMSALKK